LDHLKKGGGGGAWGVIIIQDNHFFYENFISSSTFWSSCGAQLLVGSFSSIDFGWGKKWSFFFHLGT
jgi:hypothetical protein